MHSQFCHRNAEQWLLQIFRCLANKAGGPEWRVDQTLLCFSCSHARHNYNSFSTQLIYLQMNTIMPVFKGTTSHIYFDFLFWNSSTGQLSWYGRTAAPREILNNRSKWLRDSSRISCSTFWCIFVRIVGAENAFLIDACSKQPVNTYMLWINKNTD